jgi:hypothetical protein
MSSNENKLGASPSELACKRSLSVSEDERVRGIRNRMQAAKTRIEIAMGYVMFPEVREELRCVQIDLAVALSYIEG